MTLEGHNKDHALFLHVLRYHYNQYGLVEGRGGRDGVWGQFVLHLNKVVNMCEKEVKVECIHDHFDLSKQMEKQGLIVSFYKKIATMYKCAHL